MRPTDAAGTVSASWTGLTASTIPVTGVPGSEVPVGIQTKSTVQNGRTYICQATGGPAHMGRPPEPP